MYKTVINNLQINGIETDPNQTQLIKEMSNVEKKDKSIFSKLKKNNLKRKSFYIWGDVGRGKTMITKTFLKLTKI